MSTAASVTDVRGLVRCAMFAALIAALGLLPAIPVPVLPVPITAQTLGVMLAGALLGPRRGAVAVILFIALVALGFPLLAGGRGGLGIFAAPSAGFMLGWIPGAFITGLLAQGARVSFIKLLVACLVGGIGAVYGVGIPWMAATADLSLSQAALASVVFLPGDAIKALMAAGITRAVRRAAPGA